MSGNRDSFLKLARSGFRFRLFLLFKLPSAFLAGVRIRMIDEVQCQVTVPFKWLTQNPFRSTYFACLAMAAELSTGALAMANLYKRKPPVSMLVVGLQARYFKKATGRTRFTCTDGQAFSEAIALAVATGEPVTVKARSEGLNGAGETVAVFEISWSFKARPPATVK